MQASTPTRGESRSSVTGRSVGGAEPVGPVFHPSNGSVFPHEATNKIFHIALIQKKYRTSRPWLMPHPDTKNVGISLSHTFVVLAL